MAKRIPELDGWRAVSVLLVICSHAMIQTTTNPEFALGLVHWRLLSHVLYYGGPLGVKVFFVISGFVICRLLLKEDAAFGRVSLAGFYYRRAFRILPPFLIFVGVLSALLAAGLVAGNWQRVVAHTLFLGDVQVFPNMPTIGHTWSLAVEEQFYVLFPAIFVLLPRRWLSPLLVILFVVCVGWTVMASRTLELAWIRYNARAGFGCIAWGVLLAIHEGKARRWAARVPMVVVALAGAVLLGHPLGRETSVALLYEGLAIPVMIGLVLLWSMERGAGLRAFLCSRPIQAMGLMSYGIYLWQQLFLVATDGYGAKGQWIPCLIPLLLVIVPGSYYLVEKPAMRVGRILSDRARVAARERCAVAMER